MTTICRRWPEVKDRLNPVLALYYRFRDALVKSVELAIVEIDV